MTTEPPEPGTQAHAEYLWRCDFYTAAACYGLLGVALVIIGLTGSVDAISVRTAGEWFTIDIHNGFLTGQLLTVIGVLLMTWALTFIDVAQNPRRVGGAST